MAAAQEAKSWALRAAVTLHGHLAPRGRGHEGQDLLAAVRAGFPHDASHLELAEADRLLAGSAPLSAQARTD